MRGNNAKRRRLVSERVARSSLLEAVTDAIAARLDAASFSIARSRINVHEDGNIWAVETGQWATASTQRTFPSDRNGLRPVPSSRLLTESRGAKSLDGDVVEWRRQETRKGGAARMEKSRDEKRGRSHRQPMVTMAHSGSLLRRRESLCMRIVLTLSGQMVWSILQSG